MEVKITQKTDNEETERDKKKSSGHLRVAREYLLESHVSMFEYTDLPSSVNPYFLELFLQTQSSACWLIDKRGDLIVTACTLASDLDVYGMGRDVIATTRNGESYQLHRGVDCVVGYNNQSMTACTDIFVDAATLADVKTSLDFLIFWTRLSPLIRTNDSATKDLVISAYKNIKKGIPVTIQSKRVLAEYGISDDITIQDITAPDFADKIQYTSKLYDDIIRWHYTKYGQAINGDGKAAQQTVDEVNSTTSQSLVLPLSMLRARKTMIAEVNAMFGAAIDVNFSGAWRAEVTKYETESGESSIDDSPDDADDTSNSTGATVSDDNTTGEGEQ